MRDAIWYGDMPRERLVKILKNIWAVLVYLFAAIGFVLVVGYAALQVGLTKTTGVIGLQRPSFFNSATSTDYAALPPTYPNGTPWQDTEEWQVLSAAITKNAPVINPAAQRSWRPSAATTNNFSHHLKFSARKHNSLSV